MLYLFGPKETDFVNGDSDLIPNTYDEVVDRSKGFYLKFKVALDKDKRYKNIKKEMIINAYTPDGWNQFRVFDIYNHSNHVEVVATQLHYDLNYKKVFPFNLNRATAQVALNVFVDSLKSDLPNFTFTSNITDTHNFSTDDDLERLEEGHNALEILNRIATRWGGELKVDGYNVHLVSKLGKFTNALLYEHKNISEFVDETSLSEIVTRIHAVSRFRLEREEGSAKEPEEVVIKVVVDSPLIDEYAQVYEEDYTNNDARTKEQLIAWANLKYSTNNIDKPSRSIKVETNIIDGQEINYGDDLVLKYTKHDVDEIIRCVGYQYNPNSRQYISVTLGSNMNSLSSTITGAVHDTTRNQLSSIEKQVQIIKYAANNVNRVTTGPLAIPDPIEGDMWYYHPEGRPNEVELRIFQDGGWVTIVSDMTGENVRRAIEDLELEAEGLEEDIAASDQKATEAKETADLAKSAVDAYGIITQETADKMVTVEQIVADAETNAADAISQAGQAVIDSQTAMDDANTAQTDAAISLARAQAALDKSTEVESVTNTLSLEVDSLEGAISLKADSSVVDTLQGTVQDHSTDISANATAISQRVTTTTYETGLASKENSVLKQSTAPAHLNGRLWLDTSVTPNILKRSTGSAWVKATPTTASEVGAYSSGQGSALAGRVTTAETNITQTSTALTSKADKSVVDTLSGTVSTHTTTLTQHATAISSKAAQTEVDTVKGTVSSHTSTLSQHATAISARLTETQVNDLVNDKGYSTVSYVDTEISTTAGAIRTEMTAVEGKIDGLEIGGRNLFLNSDREFAFPRHRAFNTYDIVDHLVGQPVTVSFDIKLGDGGISRSILVYRFQNSGISPAINGRVTPTTEWVRYSFTGTVLNSEVPEGHTLGSVAFYDSAGNNSYIVRRIKIEKGNIATDWTPAPEDMLKQSDFNTFKAEYEQSAQGWSAKLLQIEQADYASKTWSNQTFATPQSVTNQLASYAKTTDLNELVTETELSNKSYITSSAVNTLLNSYAKTTDLNGMVTETTLATKNFITAGSVNSLLTSYAKTDGVPTLTNFNSLKNRYDSMEQVIGTDKDSVARAVMTSSLWETEVSKVIDTELEQEYETVEGEVPFYEYTTPRMLLEGDKSMAIYLPLAADTIMDGKRVVVEMHYKARAGSKGNHASYIQYGTIKSSEPLLYSSLTSTKYHLYIPPGTAKGNIMDLHTNIVNPGNYTWGDITKITVSTVEKTQVPVNGANTGAISSKITQLYDTINMSILGADGALSRIAMGEEGIQIDGKLLHITAKTFIDDAVITTAMIDTLDASKITTGELNATNVRVINLDANSITGNEASFIRALFSGTISTLQITSDGVNILDNNGKSATYLDSSGIEFTRKGINLGKLEYVTNESDSGDLNNMHGFSMRPNRSSYFGVSYFPTSTATTSIRRFAVSGRTGNVYIAGLIKPSEQQIYGLDITWGGITGRGTNVRLMNHNRTGGIQIDNGDISYLSAGGWRSLNDWIK